MCERVEDTTPEKKKKQILLSKKCAHTFPKTRPQEPKIYLSRELYIESFNMHLKNLCFCLFEREKRQLTASCILPTEYQA